ncbi:MAG: glycosyltransferase [Hyphomicrobiaceae bacterium]|nr:glycosyltransferase [Hyphomicrobiaceae bacterium]
MIARVSRPAGAVSRVALFAGSSAAFLDEAQGLIGRLIALRHRVLCLAPDMTEGTAEALAFAGVDSRRLALAPDGWSLMPQRRAEIDIAKMLSAWGADVVLASGGPVMVTGARAARRAGLTRILAVVDTLSPPAAGASHASLTPSQRTGIERAYAAASVVACLNHDDRALIEGSGLVPPRQTPPAVVAGFGVDLSHIAAKPLPPVDGTSGLTFLMAADESRETGLLDYCDAARIVRARTPQARFLLATSPFRSGTPLPSAELDAAAEACERIATATDIRDLIALSHVFVYPAHRAAMPQRVLEALAAGRPVITSATAGCRETVDERVNGVLVVPGDAGAVARAAESFLKRPDLIPAMARASRQKAERRFDQRVCVDALLALMGIDA